MLTRVLAIAAIAGILGVGIQQFRINVLKDRLDQQVHIATNARYARATCGFAVKELESSLKLVRAANERLDARRLAAEARAAEANERYDRETERYAQSIQEAVGRNPEWSDQPVPADIRLELRLAATQ